MDRWRGGGAGGGRGMADTETAGIFSVGGTCDPKDAGGTRINSKERRRGKN